MKAFQAAFRDANEAAGKIDVLATGGSFIVRDYNFEGLETLWNIIAFATSPYASYWSLLSFNLTLFCFILQACSTCSSGLLRPTVHERRPPRP